MSRAVPVFINGTRIEMREDATALDAVRAWNAAAAREVEQGTRVLIDSRGLPIGPDVRVYGGAIFRLIAARERDTTSEPDLLH